jgi:hypothetical protein
MLRTLLFYSAFLFPTISFTQTAHFEGTIIYDLKWHDQTGEMPDDQLNRLIGQEQHYHVKGNRYRSEINGSRGMVQLYLGDDTLYSISTSAQDIVQVNVTEAQDSVISYKIVPTDEVILGYPCKVLEIITRDGYSKYWFNDQVRIDPETYTRHAYGLWYFKLKLTNGALPLKALSENKQVRFESVARSIKKEILREDMFLLPKF